MYWQKFKIINSWQNKFETAQNLSNVCTSIPSYLKLILYPKFKIFLLSSGMISTEVYLHMQHTKMK